ncbi:MAG: DUF6755 family protein [Vicinamibacteria bacterium]
MSRSSRFARSQRQIIATGILSLVGLIVILQLWLFTATMNAHLAGDDSILIPAALSSLVCLGLNAGLLRYVYHIER